MITWTGDNQSTKTTLLSRGCRPLGQLFPSKHQSKQNMIKGTEEHRSMDRNLGPVRFPFPHICMGDTW